MLTLAVNHDRLSKWLQEIAQIGLDSSKGEGLHRTALSDFDMEGRRWLMSKMEQHGLLHFVDGAMNIHCRLPSSDGCSVAEREYTPSPSRPVVMTGSHNDTVRGGGNLDGTLGVVAGLEALVRLKELQHPLKYPVELIDFTDEEGRFGGMLGSMCLAGKLTAADIDKLCAADGLRASEALESKGSSSKAASEACYLQDSVRAYVELHIEQGPVLDQCKEQLGIVTGIVGLWKAEITFLGQANHAGTTPMSMRRNAFTGCARLQVLLKDLLEAHGGPNSVATIGCVSVSPGSANVVPARSVFTLEMRDASATILQFLSQAALGAANTIAQEEGLELQYRIMSDLEPVLCNDGIMECIEHVASDIAKTRAESSLNQQQQQPQAQPAARIRYRRMPSGAAHDAQHIPQRLGPMGMIFVPSVNGISHHCSEYTTIEDICIGADALLNSLYRLSAGIDNPTAAVTTNNNTNDATTSNSSSSNAILQQKQEQEQPQQQQQQERKTESALLCIDLQTLPPSGARSMVDFTAEEAEKFMRTVTDNVIPNVHTVQSAFRTAGIEVMHTRIQSLTADGRDRSTLHKRMGIHVQPYTEFAKFLPETGPIGDEIVFEKTASNAFISTNMHYVLQNIGIRKLYVLGVLTDECVASTAKSAADLGYDVTVIADACAAVAELRHHGALATLSRYARVMSTSAVIEEITGITTAASTATTAAATAGST